jgi:hypothetical protein
MSSEKPDSSLAKQKNKPTYLLKTAIMATKNNAACSREKTAGHPTCAMRIISSKILDIHDILNKKKDTFQR